MILKLITYEEDRLNFFIEQKKLAEKRMIRLEKLVKPDEPYNSEVSILLSEVGMEVSFYNDVVEMFGKELSEKKRVQEMLGE